MIYVMLMPGKTFKILMIFYSVYDRLLQVDCFLYFIFRNEYFGSNETAMQSQRESPTVQRRRI